MAEGRAEARFFALWLEDSDKRASDDDVQNAWTTLENEEDLDR